MTVLASTSTRLSTDSAAPSCVGEEEEEEKGEARMEEAQGEGGGGSNQGEI